MRFWFSLVGIAGIAGLLSLSNPHAESPRGAARQYNQEAFRQWEHYLDGISKLRPHPGHRYDEQAHRRWNEYIDGVQAKLAELMPKEPPYTEEFKRLWVESVAPVPCEIAKPGTVCLPMDSPLRRDIENQWWVNPDHLNIAGGKQKTAARGFAASANRETAKVIPR